MTQSPETEPLPLLASLFEEGWYLEQYPEAADAGMAPLDHFVLHGDAAGCRPHPLFDPEFYSQQHDDLPRENGERLRHYIEVGEQTGSRPHRLFDPTHYRRANPDLEGLEEPFLAHYYRQGEKEQRSPSLLFDPGFYLRANPDLARVESLMSHYAEYGAGEGRAPNPLFSPDFYHAQVRDLGIPKARLLDHYLEVGDREGLCPHPLFDPGHYDPEGAVLGAESGNRLAHYLEHGQEPGPDPHPLFHSAYYAAQLTALPGAGTTLLTDYLAVGEGQKRKPNPLFDPSHYERLAQTEGFSLLEHFLLHGGGAGLSPSPLFDSRWVSAQMAGAPGNKVNPLQFYFSEGGALPKGPHPLFLPDWYRAEYPECEQSPFDALSHFMEVGARAGFDPHPLFPSDWYREFSGAHLTKDEIPIFHYLARGRELGITPNPLFDPDYYLHHCPEPLRDDETPLGHFSAKGFGKRLAPSPLFWFCVQFFRDHEKTHRQKALNPAAGYLADPYASITAPEAELPIALAPTFEPDVSIIIPVHGQAVYTLACLRSISLARNEASYEVIVVDDHSPIDPFMKISAIDNLRVFRNDEQLGFLHTCNRGAREARGKDLVLLNNDTLVTDHWLDRLIETREAFPNAGLVGSKLVFPNGKLQEAGGVVWQDGSAINYGYRGDPSSPRHAFAREVDYISAAAVLISAEIFSELGGFDESYAPAFYEDTDLAFRLREAGMQVVYQPASTVIHFGGASHGLDVTGPLKHHQIVNAEKFYRRWSTTLEEHLLPGSDVDRAALRLSGPRALVVDAAMLTPDQDSGSLRMYNLLQVLRGLGFSITFMPSNLENRSDYVEMLQREGIQVASSPHVTSTDRYLEEFGAEFELCIISRPDSAEKCMDSARLLCPNALILYDTVDLHFLRRERELRLTGVAPAPDSIRDQELTAVAQADASITVSDFDRQKLLEQVPGAMVHVISNIHRTYPQKTPFAERSGILFIGGFQHTPNIDAVLWFIADILPTLHGWIPDLRFHVIGSNPPDEIRAQASEHVVIEGFLDDVSEQFANRRLSVAPLRYGSGVKGKINQSMAYGLPCVATPPAVEGMHLEWNREILVAHEPYEFAEAVAELYENETLWSAIARDSVASIERDYSMDVARKAVQDLLRHHGRRAPKNGS